MKCTVENTSSRTKTLRSVKSGERIFITPEERLEEVDVHPMTRRDIRAFAAVGLLVTPLNPDELDAEDAPESVAEKADTKAAPAGDPQPATPKNAAQNAEKAADKAPSAAPPAPAAPDAPADGQPAPWQKGLEAQK